ncbi:MAG: aminofutalosine synthase MqnE [Ignavibacteria bacterium]|nr:aminofutalosine synthase MqnE [Ignavibacteria bacterium]MBI3764930.1 aminofutalosine synthase MqnE [Ignavibacteriales bacterium]
MPLNFRDALLLPIWDKVQQGDRLSLEDGLALYNTNDIISLGKMAHFVQQQKSGDAVYFVLNQKIEHTNICILSCKFCDFAVKKGNPDAYEMTTEDILATLTPEIAEVHITGGMPADWPWERYVDIVRSIHEKFPHADVKAYTAVEIDFFHKKFKLSIEEVLRQLKEAGLRTMPGGGAEVFSERVRKLLFNQKIGAKTWFEVHKTAHRLGIPTNSTMLYGHVETLEERLIHMIKLREAQDETGGFLTFIPLAFQPGDTGIKPRNHFTSAIDDLKTIAISRLMLDNFPHIKAYWVMLTEEVASVALNFGADDMDGTVGYERIAHDAGATSPMKLAKDQIIKIIKDAGKIPVERDVYYDPLNVYSDYVIGKIPYLNSVPFYHHFEKLQFKILPIVPRRMGLLEEQGQIIAGPFSLMDYFRQEEQLELLPFCIATRDQVKSVMLFSKEGWLDLNGKTIGITDETATSVHLLQVLLEKKYDVKATFERMHAGVNDYSKYDAVLLIGDEALHRNKHGLAGFELVFDLAKEWYDWKKMPFVFAVWAVKKSLPEETKIELDEIIGHSLSQSEPRYADIGELHGKQIGLSRNEVEEYLTGFNYRLGEREREAMREFRKLITEIESNTVPYRS